jgi:hypothetical protein
LDSADAVQGDFVVRIACLSWVSAHVGWLLIVLVGIKES